MKKIKVKLRMQKNRTNYNNYDANKSFKKEKKTHRLEQLQGKLRFERCRQDSFQYIETSPHRN